MVIISESSHDHLCDWCFRLFNLDILIFCQGSLLWMNSIIEFWRDEVNMPRMWASKCHLVCYYRTETASYSSRSYLMSKCGFFSKIMNLPQRWLDESHKETEGDGERLRDDPCWWFLLGPVSPGWAQHGSHCSSTAGRGKTQVSQQFVTRVTSVTHIYSSCCFITNIFFFWGPQLWSGILY